MTPTCTFTVNHPGGKHPFTLFDTPLGRVVCEEVLTGKSYPLVTVQGPIRTIVDIGANVGAAAVYFALNIPTARIFAFEPSPDCFTLLAANTASLPQVKAFPYGLFSEERAAQLRLGKGDSVTSSVGSSIEAGETTVTVQLREAAQVFREQGIDEIDILKIDTEGCEPPILQSISEWIPKIGIVYVEYHSEPDRLAIDRLLAPTHLLYRGTVPRPCRGEFCYVSRMRLPEGLEAKSEIRL